MFLVLTMQDLAKLSPELKAELKEFAFGRDSRGLEEGVFEGIDARDVPWLDAEGDSAPPWPEAFEKLGDSKMVVDISENEARALLGNLSAKSIDTLRLFASGESVLLDSLVGEGRPYESFSELKRSFVGAVNRRLRTVTRNRSAVLFRRVDADRGNSIEMRPKAATALQKALTVTSLES